MAGDEYDRVDRKPIGIPGARVLIGHSHDRGEVTAFVVQLEYQLESDSAAGDAGDWVEVVRSDHHSTSAGGHDVREEGVHLDVYRDGEKHRTDQLSGPVGSANTGFTTAEERITEDAERYVKRFRQWHKNNRDGSSRPNERSD